MISKDLYQLLELQKSLDDEIAKPRLNKFTPRPKTLFDIRLAIDDEFQEWLKELPKELNFKTWKQKEYDRNKELEELTDVLFFYLQYLNQQGNTFVKKGCAEIFNEFITKKRGKIVVGFELLIKFFKVDLYDADISDSFRNYTNICIKRDFSAEEIIEMYLKKWEINMKRINRDWMIKND